MVLYFVGLGLGDEKDITVKGLELVKESDVLYLESYTSKLDCKIEDLEKFYDKKIVIADRNLVENEAESTILKDAKEKKVSFLVIGDPMAATTHVDLMLRAKKNNIKVQIVNNASVLTAVGIIGLELYKFGKTTSIPFDNKDITSPVEVFNNNQEKGLHTLFLLDLKPLENKFMATSEAVNYLIKKGLNKDLKAISCAALGSEEPVIKYATLQQLKDIKINKFPQCLIIPGKLHFMEEEVLNLYST